ncbi:glycoside hydrolase family 1 protein [Demequina salsinemoris]|uniref:glycoside hydrolase family 1 protein n=1 Tax=Demequina salsinemoris TaxID=577470 RepID=UPI0007834C47|nr:family 1 glycosylhydrolase [Demequina salsinemoris]
MTTPTSPFLWGAATAAHQVEGNNTTSDWWASEHNGNSVIKEPSLDAADHLHRWPEDLDILSGLGLTAYRFSIEWSRIEPEKGFKSHAYLDHYRRMIVGCLSRGLSPVITLQHVTLPQWLREMGGWSHPDAAALFAEYTSFLAPALNEGVDWVVTINEPNLQPLMTRLHAEDPQVLNAWNGGAMPEATDAEVAELIAAHRAAVSTIRSTTSAKAGWSVAINPVHTNEAGAEAAARYSEIHEDVYLRASREDDFVGVQTYTRSRFGEGGALKPTDDIRMTQLWEFYPEALGEAVRHAKSIVGEVPVFVTENGIPTANDEERVEYLERALPSLADAMADGVDVRGYLHWSAIDNFEWALGYAPTFGLISSDPVTFERTVKPSAHWYGDYIKAHATPAQVAKA